jgi:hypothetical protein
VLDFWIDLDEVFILLDSLIFCTTAKTVVAENAKRIRLFEIVDFIFIPKYYLFNKKGYQIFDSLSNKIILIIA